MKHRRIQKVNSLLREVLSQVILRDLPHRNIPELITITAVSISKDLQFAKVYISLLGSDINTKTATLANLQKMSKYIAVISSKKISLRYFPELLFKLDDPMES